MKVQRFPIYFLLPPMQSLSHYQHCLLTRLVHFFFNQPWTYIQYHNHLKSIVYPRVHSCCGTIYGLGQMYNDIYQSLQYHTECFYCPKKSSVFYLSFSLQLSSDPIPSKKPSQIPPWKCIFPSPRTLALGASHNLFHSFPSFRFMYMCVSRRNLTCRNLLISTVLPCTQPCALPLCSVGAQ